MLGLRVLAAVADAERDDVAFLGGGGPAADRDVSFGGSSERTEHEERTNERMHDSLLSKTETRTVRNDG
jgi:hypothetical protein